MRRRKTRWMWAVWMAAAVLLAIFVSEENAAVREQPAVQTGKQITEETGTREPERQKKEELSLHAQSAVLIDGKTGRVLYGKGEGLQRPMASTTKIMTCILALEKGNLEDPVQVSQKAASQPKVRLGMKEGETYYLKDLLYALMLESYNDAAVAIAEHIGNTTEGFAEMMNEKARSLGCQNTYFITPNGLDAQIEGSDGTVLVHSTTAEDLARMMAYCVLESSEKERFLEITRTRNYCFSDTGNKKTVSCVNHNALLDMDKELLSGKTGFTGGAGYSYVAAEETEGRIFAIALLGCGWPPDKTWKWEDAKKLFAYGKNHFFYRDVYQEPEFPELPAKDGIPQSGNLSEPAVVQLFSEGEKKFPVLLREGEEVKVRVKLPESFDAPIQENTEVGEIRYILDGQIIRRDPIKVRNSVKKISMFWCLEQVVGEYAI